MFSGKIKTFFSSIRLRLTVLYITLLGITLSIFCTVLLKRFVSNHQQEFDYALYNHAVDAAQSFTVDYFGEFVFTPNSMLVQQKVFPFSLGKSFVQVISPEGRIVVRSPNLEDSALPISAEELQTVFRRGHAYRTLTAADMKHVREAQPGENYRQISYIMRRGRPLFIMQVAVPTTLLDRETGDLIEFFFLGIPIALLLAALAGIYLASKALSPIREIIKKAELLNPSNLRERLPEPNTADEIHMLTVTLNGLLGRIERAFESLENFIADASHQLKTPLAILRGELDVFRSKVRSAEEISAFTESASQELQHLSRLVDDLLTLTKIDAGAGSLLLRQVRLDEVLMETLARFEVLAQKRNINIRVDLEDKTQGKSESDFLVNGDPDLIQSMFRNLVDNAIKYSPDSSLVEVKVVNELDRVITHIRDFGDPIPPDVEARLFQRYERGNLRLNSISGTGLGLTIAKRIAEMHRSKITISQDNSPGKAFSVEMNKN